MLLKEMMLITLHVLLDLIAFGALEFGHVFLNAFLLRITTTT